MARWCGFVVGRGASDEYDIDARLMLGMDGGAGITMSGGAVVCVLLT